MKKKGKAQRAAEAREGTRWLGAIIGGIGGYSGAEMLLRSQPHPLHWLAALAFGVFGYGALALLQRRKGSI